MPITLRDYQKHDVGEILSSLRARQNVMYALPPGGGKTVVATEVAARMILPNPRPNVFWLTHREILELQSERTLSARGIPQGRMNITSPMRFLNALARNEIRVTSEDLLILDEAQHATAPTWSAAINAFPGYILGLSGSPWRLELDLGFNHLYDKMIIGPQKSELIKRKQLTPSLMKRPQGRLLRGIGGGAGREYSTSQTMNQSKSVLVERGIDWLVRWDKLRGPLRTIAYCINVPHAEAVREYAERQHGISAAVLHSKMPKSQRDKASDDFENERAQLLINVAILTEGYDVPGASCALLLRPTASLSLWLQMCGRPSRLADGKESALILETTTNPDRFGHPDDNHIWSLLPRGEHDPNENGGGSAVIRHCPECETQNSTATRQCSACGFVFGLDCPRCGWSAGYSHNGEFIIPNPDPGTGACYKCSIKAQDSLIGHTVFGFNDFRKLFRQSDAEKDKWTFYDNEMNISYWLGPDKYPSGRARGRSFVGGVYLSDRVTSRYLSPGAFTHQQGSNTLIALFNGRRIASGKNRREVQRQLFDNIYLPVAQNIKEAFDSIAQGRPPRMQGLMF